MMSAPLFSWRPFSINLVPDTALSQIPRKKRKERCRPSDRGANGRSLRVRSADNLSNRDEEQANRKWHQGKQV
jgi:hypothetical protein